MRRLLFGLALISCACRGAEASRAPTEGATANGPRSHQLGRGADHADHGGEHGAPATADGHVHHGGHHRFDDAKAWAEVFDDPARDAWQRPDDVVRWMGLPSDAVVADIGAGTGYFAVRFARALPGGRVVASDIEESMVAYMRERASRDGLANLSAVKGTAGNSAIGEAIDVAFMCDVVHHISDRGTYFRTLADDLRSGGRLVIVDFKKDAPAHAPGPPTQMRIRADDLIAELDAVGYRLLRRDSMLLEHQYLLEFSAPE